MTKKHMARALWHENRRQSAIREQEIHPSGSRSIHFTTVCSLVSIGTEGLVARGEVPETIHDTLEVPGMEGDFSLPVKFGYSLCGFITGQPDQYYHLMYPHQTACYVDPEVLTPIPDGVPPGRAALASQMETAVNALWDGRPCLGERCLVLGYGLIGALIAHLLRKTGLEVYIIEPDHSRRTLAKENGFVVCEREEREFDLVFNASGRVEALNDIFPNTAMETRLVELSWMGTHAARLKMGSHFHFNRLRIIGSQVSHIPGHMSSRWDLKRRKKLVMKLLDEPALDALLTHQIPLEQTPQLFQKIRQGQVEGIGYLITYN